jgi:hypothetical protein
MAKAMELSLETMTAPPIPKAAQSTTPAAEPRKGREVKAAPQEPREPLQVRWPGEDVKAAKLAALQMDFPTVSEFMLACFHAYMKNAK